jgi:predicted metal-dependent phosphoesterase TrpH
VIDLHTHSSVSDGTERPARVVDLAATAGCSAIALTDHDRLDGLEEASERAEALGIRLVPGCELSCASATGGLHLLVYFVSPASHALGEALGRLQGARDTRNARMVERLRGLGLPISPEELHVEAGGIGVGRPHMAAVLLRNGAVASIEEAFDRYLAQGRPGHVEKERLTPAEAITLALDSGGVAVLAHPLSLGMSWSALERAVRELAAVGLAGVEAIYARYTPEERASLAALASATGLAVTGGSDFHGAYKPGLSIGIGYGDLSVSDELLTALEDRRTGGPA